MNDEPPCENIHIGDHAHIEGDVFTGGKHIHITQPSLPPLLHSLNDPPPDFTGREQELAQLRKTFAAGKGAMISGLSGVGKSALARALCRELAERFPAAQLEIDLQGPSNPLDPYATMRRLLERFYPQARLPDDPGELGEIYRATLRERACLLLLDNARSAEQVKPLLPPSPSAAVVTSRWEFSLPAQGLRPLRLGVLDEADAAAFLRRAAPRLAESPQARLAALIQQCGHLPLALRIAAALFEANPDWRLEDLLKRLQDERRRLAQLKDPDDPELDVEASLELSYRLLEGNLPRLFRRLGMFELPFELEAAASLCDFLPAGEAEGGMECREALNALRRHGLLEYRFESGEYDLHDLVRLFARARLLTDEGEATQCLGQAADYFLATGSAAENLYRQGGEQVAPAVQRFRRLWPHLEALWRILAGKENGWPKWPGAERWLCDLPDRLAYLLNLALMPLERLALLESALAAARELGDRQAECLHLGNLGLAHKDLGEPRRAIEFYQQQRQIALEIGNRQAEGAAVGNLASAYFLLGELRQAIELHEQDLEIVHEIGDRRGEGAALSNLGLAYSELREPRRAIEYYEQALVIERQTGDRRAEGAILGNLGNAFNDLGESRRSIEYYEQALAIDSETSDRRGQGNDLGNLGNAYSNLGESRRAIEFYEQALEIAREIGDRWGEGNDLANLGLEFRKLGEMERARTYWEQALAIYRAIEDPNAARVQRWLEEAE